MKPYAYNDTLVCHFHGWRVVSENEIALDMPKLNCCDMRGAISIAEKIMPNVQRIYTFLDGVPDTEYRATNGKWTAHSYLINNQTKE